MSTSSKIWMAITGIALIVLGILCICYPGATLLSAAIFFGITTLVSGCSTIATWTRVRRFLPSGNLLLSGILQILLGIIFLNNNFLVAVSLPIVFALWLAVEGVIIAIRSFDFKQFNMPYWWVVLIMGILLAASGIVSLRYPMDVAAPVFSYVIGVIIMLFGIVDIVALYGLAKVEK